MTPDYKRRKMVPTEVLTPEFLRGADIEADSTITAGSGLAAGPAWHQPCDITVSGMYFIWCEHRRFEDEPIRAIRVMLPYTIGDRPEDIARFWAGWKFFGPIPEYPRTTPIPADVG